MLNIEMVDVASSPFSGITESDDDEWIDTDVPDTHCEFWCFWRSRMIAKL